MSITPQAFHVHLQHLSAAEKYLIAYSGGVDSHVLLHLCAQLKNAPSGFKQSFSAVYIDHGLNAQAQKWGQHCQQICYELDIPLTIVAVDGRAKNGQSPEAAARTARYNAFAQLLTTDECLLTAQHLADQAETLLLQLLRGSGTKGLAAMPRIKPFAKGFLCRPILDYTQQDILNYARQHQLHWVEDDSNAEEHFDRNYLRHSILPLLEKRWPAAQENIAKSAEVLAESQFLLEKMANADLHDLVFINKHGFAEQDKLLLAPILALFTMPVEQVIHCHHHELARVHNVLRFWIQSNHLPLPSKKILEQIIQSVLLAREDAMPIVTWQRDGCGCEVRKYQNILYLLKVPDGVGLQKTTSQVYASFQATLLEKNVLKLPNDIGTLILDIPKPSLQQVVPYDREKLLSKPLSIKFRSGGERYRRHPNEHSHSLKHWFQEQAIPPWQRAMMPLIFWGDELLQIGNFVLNHSLDTYAVNQPMKQHNGVVDDFLSYNVDDSLFPNSANSLIIYWQRENN